jgi:hypothetical protein
MDVFAKAVEADPIGGSELINEVVYSYLSDQAEELKPEIDALIGQFVVSRVNIAKRQMGRAYVESVVEGQYPDDDVQKHAQWLAGIESYVVAKDATDTFERMYDGRSRSISVQRNARGQFTRGVSTTKQSLPFGLKAREVAPTASRALNDKKDDYKGSLTEDKKVRLQQHQAQFEQASQHVDDILNAFKDGDHGKLEFAFHIQDPSTQDIKTITVDGKTLAENNGYIPHDDLKRWSLDENIIAVDVNTRLGETDPNVISQVSAYNTMGLTGNKALQAYFNADPAARTAFQNSLKRPNDRSQSGLKRFFNMLGTGGSVVRSVDPSNQLAQMAEFVGSVGPEATEILGPYAQEAAYRYRGTEKEPDLDLVRQFGSSSMRVMNAAAEQRTPISEIAQRVDEAATEGKNRRDSDLVVMSTDHQIKHLSRTRGGAFTPDELKLNVQSDIAARHLLNTLPDDPFVAELSREAGNVLPSQGVIIDIDGDVVSQSVGYADDHYLPFNLKNLKSLAGGQYVRTRQQGGLTGEDIYTAARSGARMSTVVSSSGVFSLEFDPNFRGGRANTDRARQMYDRYLKILDAVENSRLYIQDIPPAKKEEIRQKAKMVANNSNGQKDADVVYTEMLNNERNKDEPLSQSTLDSLMLEAQNSVGPARSNSSYQRAVSDAFDELVSAKRNERASRLSLNSAGYEAALKTLQQQFPYYIRNVSFQPLTSKVEGEGFLQTRGSNAAAGARQRLFAEDKGYVRPGGMKANSLESGFFRQASEANPKGTRNGMIKTPDVVEPKDKASGSTGSTGTSGSTGSSSSTGEKTPLPTGGLMKVISAANKTKLLELQPVTEDFANKMARLPDKAMEKKTDDRTWDEVKSLSDETALRYLMTMDNATELPSIINKDPERVAELLTDSKAVSTMADTLYKGAEPDAYLGDFGTARAIADHYINYGKNLNEAVSAQNPFVNPLEGDEGAFYSGRLPQLFDDVLNMSSTDDVSSFLSNPSNKKIVDGMQDLMFKGDEERDAASLTKAFQDNTKNLKKINDAYSKLEYSGSDMPDLGDLALKASLRPEEIKNALGLSDEVIEDLEADPKTLHNKDGFLVIDTDYIRSRANDLQKAYSVITATRLLEGVGASPKASAPAEGAMTKSLSKRYSSRQVQLVSKHHPLAQEMQYRRSRNLPLL